MDLSFGQKLFTLLFAIAFAVLLIWAYRTDIQKRKEYYKGSWKILLWIAIILAAIVVFTKIMISR
ncbi:MAG: hypothetical protein COA57_02525 [Flavobacteriales bacterium]|nr:MAG: hypothetical protein COA57_02525 [Flavobacteriales bacterium]